MEPIIKSVDLAEQIGYTRQGLDRYRLLAQKHFGVAEIGQVINRSRWFTRDDIALLARHPGNYKAKIENYLSQLEAQSEQTSESSEIAVVPEVLPPDVFSQFLSIEGSRTSRAIEDVNNTADLIEQRRNELRKARRFLIVQEALLEADEDVALHRQVYEDRKAKHEVEQLKKKQDDLGGSEL